MPQPTSQVAAMRTASCRLSPPRSLLCRRSAASLRPHARRRDRQTTAHLCEARQAHQPSPSRCRHSCSFRSTCSSASPRMASSNRTVASPGSIVRRRRFSLATTGRQVGIDCAPDDLRLAIKPHGGRGKQLAKVADEHAQRGDRLRFPAGVVDPPEQLNLVSSRRPAGIRPDLDVECRQPLIDDRDGLDLEAQGHVAATGGCECAILRASGSGDLIASHHLTDGFGGSTRSAMTPHARSRSAGCKSVHVTP